MIIYGLYPYTGPTPPPPPPTSGWKTLPIGAGGFLTGISISADNTMVIRTDTYGAYLWNATALSPVGTIGTWQQVCTSTSMPNNFTTMGNSAGSSQGVWDIQVSWSDDVLYMIWSDVADTYPLNQAVYKSTNKGVTWSKTGFTAINVDTYLGGDGAGGTAGLKAWGPRLSIDPTTSQNVLMGTGQNGLFYTTNGGTSWTNISSGLVPYALQYGSGPYPGYTVCIGVFSSVQYLFAYSFGNGIYLSRNGGSSWTNITSSGPTIVQTVVFDQHTGYFYCVDGLGNAWQYTASAGSPAWTKIYTEGTQAVDIAVDPNNANHLVIVDGNGAAAESTNGTSFGTFATHNQSGQPITTGDIPWMSNFDGCNANRVVFDSLTAKKIYGASNRDILTTSWTGTISSGTNLSWTSQSRGIEQLVGNVTTVPTTGKPILGFWDSGLASNLILSAYPALSNFYPGNPNVLGCWSVDYAVNNSNFVAALLDSAGIDGSSGDISAYSTNAGASWTLFPSSAPNSGNGGSIAVSTSTNWLFAPGGQQPSYTTNGGTTWNAVSISGISSWTNMSSCVFGGRSICADGLTTGTFYLFLTNSGFSAINIYVTTNNGASWTSLGSFSIHVYGNAIIKATPGVAGDFWLIPGGTQGGGLYHYSSGSLNQITNFYAAMSVGFGKNSSGGYPSVFVAGFDGSSGPGTYGIYRSDNASTGVTPTWNQIGSYPLGNIDGPRDISGDPSIYGRCYMALTGSGFMYYNP